MKIQKYIDLVFKKKKPIFKDIKIDKDFEWDNLIKLCDLSFSNECLIVAWSLIIDAISETYKNENIIFFMPEKVLNFLIENNICLMDLAHLKLPAKYLLMIYDKDNSCWEVLRTMDCYNKRN